MSDSFIGDDSLEKSDGETVSIDSDELEVEDTEDGGAVIRLKDEQDNAENRAHFANIVDEVDPSELATTCSELLEKIERDKEARSKRDKLYEEGLRRTGLGDDAPGGRPRRDMCARFLPDRRAQIRRAAH